MGLSSLHRDSFVVVYINMRCPSSGDNSPQNLDRSCKNTLADLSLFFFWAQSFAGKAGRRCIDSTYDIPDPFLPCCRPPICILDWTISIRDFWRILDTNSFAVVVHDACDCPLPVWRSSAEVVDCEGIKTRNNSCTGSLCHRNVLFRDAIMCGWLATLSWNRKACNRHLLSCRDFIFGDCSVVGMVEPSLFRETEGI
jgi:hypothetical protein